MAGFSDLDPGAGLPATWQDCTRCPDDRRASCFPLSSEAEVSVEDQQQPMAEAQAEQPAAEAAAAESETTAEAPDAAAESGDRAASLEAELTALRQEHETVRSQYMRIAADFDNFRKRQQRDAEDLKLQLTCSTLGEILPVSTTLSAPASS